MPEHFADRLLAAIDQKGAPVCVGLDPFFERLPEELQRGVSDEVEQTECIGRFCREVLDIVAPIVPAVKIQSACFERYGSVGVDLYETLVGSARGAGLVVIGDVKRNDIGSTARAYAAGHMKGRFSPSGTLDRCPDAITVNGYFGADGLSPFVAAAVAGGKGVFVLVRTSNPSAAAIQDFADATGKKFYEHLAEQVAALGAAEELIGQRGYSCVGAVVAGTTHAPLTAIVILYELTREPLVKGEEILEYCGVLKDYTAEFVEIMDVDYRAKKDEPARKADIVVPRRRGVVRHLAE